MLNLTRLHLGIAHESQFQGLGISRFQIDDKLKPGRLHDRQIGGLVTIENPQPGRLHVRRFVSRTRDLIE